MFEKIKELLPPKRLDYKTELAKQFSGEQSQLVTELAANLIKSRQNTQSSIRKTRKIVLKWGLGYCLIAIPLSALFVSAERMIGLKEISFGKQLPEIEQANYIQQTQQIIEHGRSALPGLIVGTFAIGSMVGLSVNKLDELDGREATNNKLKDNISDDLEAIKYLEANQSLLKSLYTKNPELKNLLVDDQEYILRYVINELKSYLRNQVVSTGVCEDCPSYYNVVDIVGCSNEGFSSSGELCQQINHVCTIQNSTKIEPFTDLTISVGSLNFEFSVDEIKSFEQSQNN